jgi:hypothetical protein
MTILASVVAFYAWRLSATGRGAIDYVVLALIALAVLWNLVQLGRRLYRAGGARNLWHLLRTLLFWIAGLSYTVLAVAGDPRNWMFWPGYAVLALAAFDTVALWHKERACIR